MLYQFTKERLHEFQGLYYKHFGIEVSLDQAEEKLAALVAMLRACSKHDTRGRDSNPAPVNSYKNINE